MGGQSGVRKTRGDDAGGVWVSDDEAWIRVMWVGDGVRIWEIFRCDKRQILVSGLDLVGKGEERGRHSLNSSKGRCVGGASTHSAGTPYIC